MRPTSVTRPTLSFLSQVAVSADADADALASADADALAAADGAADAAADGAAADGEAELPLPEHAETKMARPANRVKPRRLCMCPPPDPSSPGRMAPVDARGDPGRPRGPQSAPMAHRTAWGASWAYSLDGGTDPVHPRLRPRARRCAGDDPWHRAPGAGPACGHDRSGQLGPRVHKRERIESPDARRP